MLWTTRRRGLASLDKSRVQTLLHAPSLSEFYPLTSSSFTNFTLQHYVPLYIHSYYLQAPSFLPSMADFGFPGSLIRKSVHHNYGEDDLLKLFPHDLPLDLKRNLVIVLLKYKDNWREELSEDQIKTRVPLPSKSIIPPETSASARPCQDDPSFNFRRVNFGPVDNSTSLSFSESTPLQRDCGAPQNPENVAARLKSMTWTTDTQKEPTENVAVVTLKLEIHLKSPSEEVDVKFQLTRDTFEAMLRSLTYINEQLSSPHLQCLVHAGASSVPLQKKQKQ